MFGLKVLFDIFKAWLRVLPELEPLPQILHTLLIFLPPGHYLLKFLANNNTQSQVLQVLE
jgi:hypothetical protein